MTYEVIVPKPVQKQLDKLPDKEYERVMTKIVSLKKNPRPGGCVKLKAYKDEFRVRIGSYRIRYLIDNEKSLVILLHCMHRKDIYRK
ncbi:MAG: type II toxin-antitoxin system RelE/ParE family toxin [bacterium]